MRTPRLDALMQRGFGAALAAASCATWLALTAACSPASQTQPTAPAPLTADMTNLEGVWRFHTDPGNIGEAQGWHKPGQADATWRTLRVPGYWEPQGITETRPGEGPRPRNGMPWTDYDGVAWYRRTITIPRAWAGKPLLLQLGSVDDGDRTFVNGELVGETPVTRTQAVLVQRSYRVPASLLRPGEANLIAVKVIDGGGPGGIMGPNVCIVPEEIFSAPVRLPGSDRPLAERFQDPPASARILKIIHNWPDDPADQDRLIKTLASQGFGGVVSNISFDQYLRSEAKWKAFVRGVGEARKAGMSQWLYDEKGYPSGLAGGLTLKDHPEWEARGLLIAETTTEGAAVDLETPPGKLLLAAAYPMKEGDLDRAAAVPLTPEAGRVKWTPPTGSWRVLVITEDHTYEGTHAAHNLAEHTPYINLLMPEPTARFIELTHREYAKRLGRNLGDYFVSTFTDEPSLMSLYLSRMPYKVLPWAPNLPGEFARRRGRPLEPLLPHLVAGNGAVSMKARHDFWLTVGELVSESFFGQIQKACAPLGVLSGGHLLMEESFSQHIPLYGDFMRCARRLDAPSIDCLTSIPSQVPWHIARLIGSVADLEGRTVTMSETSDHVQVWRPAGDTRPIRVVSEAEIRGTCNRLVLGGINTITSYYRFQDLTGEQLRRINAYVGRCCTMLKGGHQVADVALVYPAESAWVRFRPSRHMTTEAGDALRVERAFRTTSEVLYAARRDFTYIDSRALVESKVVAGALVHGKLRWRVVVLPFVDTLPAAAWNNLQRFVATGGILIAVGARPANSEVDFPSERVRRMATSVFGQREGLSVTSNASGGVGAFLPEGSEPLLPNLIDSLLAPDVDVQAGASIRVTHRRIDGHEVFYLINDSESPWKGSVSVCASGPGEAWDPMTGARRPVTGPTRIPVTLDAYASVFLRFARVREPQRRASGRAALPQVQSRKLPVARVTHAGGEHVQADLAESLASGAMRWWTLAGTVKRSGVDTFLFANFAAAEPWDVSGAAFIRLDVRTPSRQDGAPQLLMILTDSRGVQYWSETGRSLSTPSSGEILVPLSSFAHAPFSSGPAGALDWRSIASISVGWGGHLGTEGDRIIFEMTDPAAGTLAPRTDAAKRAKGG